jgi:hypothetical protein
MEVFVFKFTSQNINNMVQEILQSPFILEKSKITKWENRAYIKNLLLLFRLMKKQKLSPPEGQLYFLLRNKYQEEYMGLLRESDPLKYQVYLEEQQKFFMLQQEQTKTLKAHHQLLVEQKQAEYEQWMALRKIA